MLIGFACCYKSAVGAIVARARGMRFVDCDALTQQLAGASVQELFHRGEAEFRRYESAALDLLSDSDGTVIACGGGSVLSPSFELVARGATVVWLTASAATVKTRLGHTPRPLFDGLDERQLCDFIRLREPIYRKYAQLQLSTDGMSPDEVATRLLALLH